MKGNPFALFLIYTDYYLKYALIHGLARLQERQPSPSQKGSLLQLLTSCERLTGRMPDGKRRANPAMKIGYARVSKDDQDTALQLDALEAEGCDRIFQDEGISAVGRRRPGFAKAMQLLKPGDTFVIWKLDRAFRSTVEAILRLEDLRQKGITFKIITTVIDMGTPEGRHFYRELSSWAEFERDMISQRTKEGMAAAKRRGKHVGRPPKLTADQIQSALEMLKDPAQSYGSVAELFGVHRSTLRRAVHREKVPLIRP